MDDGPIFPPPGSLEALGGREAVAQLVDRFYDRIEADPVLRPAFSRDLTEEREKVKHFFEGWFGGSPSYFDAGWRLGLQATHGSVSISRGMAGRWIGHFFASLAEAARDSGIVPELKPIIARMAMGLVNRDDEPVPGERLRCSFSGSDPLFLRPVQRDDAAGLVAAATERPSVLPRQGPRLLLIAAVRGKAGVARELLRQGVDANAPALLTGAEAKTQGLPMLLITPLCGAIARGRDAVVKLLIEHGAQYDIFTAAFVGDEDGVRALLDQAPDLADARDPAGDVAPITPLLHAVATGQLAVARLLLQRGATVGANSVRLLRTAGDRGDEPLTDLLLDHRADATSLDAGEWVQYPTVAAKLLAHGADVNRRPGAWIGMCCTGNSGHKENPALARGMLRCGADVAAGYKGRTALHCAAKAGFGQVVEALIEYGADVNARNARGATPLDETDHAGQSIDVEPVRRLLIAHGGRRSTG